MGIPMALILKIGGFLLVVGLIYGAYSYVTDLQSDKEELQKEVIQITDMNNTLTETIAETERMQTIRDEVGGVSRDIREENKRIKDTRDRKVDNLVQSGQDREVGPLLKEFFNAE
jgi:septal ring factor EnvC (AmiA/AmiB activator)